MFFYELQELRLIKTILVPKRKAKSIAARLSKEVVAFMLTRVSIHLKQKIQ
jgi:hypothetical protein